MEREQLNPLPQIPNVEQARTCFSEVYISLPLQPPHIMVAVPALLMLNSIFISVDYHQGLRLKTRVAVRCGTR